MTPITKQELECLMAYISSFYLLHQKGFTRGYIFGTKFYIVKFDSQFGNILIRGLNSTNRFRFINDFGMYALKQLFELYEPEEGYFVFGAGDSLFMTTIFHDTLKVKRINKTDLQ